MRNGDEYEVCGHQWADQSSPDGKYGVTILSDAKYGWDKPDAKSLRLTLLHTPSCGGYIHQANMDIGLNRFTYALLPHQGGWSADTQKQAGELNQPLAAFASPRHLGQLPRRQSFASLSTEKVSIKALKKAEDTDELIVRVYEWSGEDQQGVRLSLPVPVVSAREVSGIEEDLGPATTEEGVLVFDIGRYQPRTFALRLAASPLLTDAAKVREAAFGTPVALPYSTDLMSFDSNRGNAVTTYTYAYPAELIPDTLEADGIGFVMGSRKDGDKNVLLLNTGKTISFERQAGQDKLYLLLASPTPAGSTVTVTAGDEETELAVPYFSGRAAEPPTCTRLDANYRRDDIVLAASHAHKVSDKSNQTMQMLYIYKYAVRLPEDVGSVTIKSSDRKTFLFAATLSAAKSDDVASLAPLTTEVGDEMVNDQWSMVNWMDDRLVPRTVTASHQNGTNEAGSKANDMDPTTKWCATSSQSQTPYLQYVMRDTVTITRWMVLGAARENGDYVARSFKLQYQQEDGTWVDADLVEDNQQNKVVRTLASPVTTTRVRLQMIQGEQSGYTTRIYEFAVFGYRKGEDPVGIDHSPLNIDHSEVWYDLSGKRSLPQPLQRRGERQIYVGEGRKVLR